MQASSRSDLLPQDLVTSLASCSAFHLVMHSGSAALMLWAANLSKGASSSTSKPFSIGSATGSGSPAKSSRGEAMGGADNPRSSPRPARSSCSCAKNSAAGSTSSAAPKASSRGGGAKESSAAAGPPKASSNPSIIG